MTLPGIKAVMASNKKAWNERRIQQLEDYIPVLIRHVVETRSSSPMFRVVRHRLDEAVLEYRERTNRSYIHPDADRYGD